MKVKDSAGNIINGLHRTPTGGLLIIDPVAYNKYKRDKNTISEINALKIQVESLTKMLSDVLNNNLKDNS